MRLAVGFFDGVHLGHQEVLRGADEILTFRNHPLSLLCPELAPRFLMTCADRLEALAARGARRVRALDFTRELAALSPAEFVSSHLLAACAKEDLVVRCTDVWRFGCGGKGNADFLRAQGIAVEIVPHCLYRDEMISSTRIRQTLAAGDVASARAMLGRAPVMVGMPFRGKGEGVRMGFPTVNVRPSPELVTLPRGVYVVEDRGVRAVANFGIAPTMGRAAWPESIWELHYLSDPPTVAAGEMCFEVLARLRGERQFATVEELRRQISEDCRTASGFGPLAKAN